MDWNFRINYRCLAQVLISLPFTFMMLANVAMAQEVNSNLNAENLENIKSSIDNVSKAFKTIGVEIESLTKEIKRIDKEIFDLGNSGDTAKITKGEKSTIDYFSNELVNLQEIDKSAKSKRADIIGKIDKIHNAILDIRYRKKTPKGTLKLEDKPAKFLKDKMLANIQLMLEDDELSKINAAIKNNADKVTIDDLASLENAITKFRSNLVGDASDSADTLLQQITLVKATLSADDFVPLIKEEFEQSPDHGGLLWLATTGLLEEVSTELRKANATKLLEQETNAATESLRKFVANEESTFLPDDDVPTSLSTPVSLDETPRQAGIKFLRVMQTVLLNLTLASKEGKKKDKTPIKNPIVETGSLDGIAQYASALEEALEKMNTGDLAHLGMQFGKVQSKLPNALEELVTDIQTLQAKEALKIRILEATVGDTYGKSYSDCLDINGLLYREECVHKVVDTYHKHRNSKRWCDATMATRVACDRKGECDFSDATVGNQVLPAGYQSRLCGFNPAPTADPRHRGVHVFYQCLRDHTKNFENDPIVVGSIEAKSMTEEFGDVQYALLRQGGQIVCPGN